MGRLRQGSERGDEPLELGILDRDDMLRGRIGVALNIGSEFTESRHPLALQPRVFPGEIAIGENGGAILGHGSGGMIRLRAA